MIERENDSGRPWTSGGGDRVAIRSPDMTTLGFLDADKIGRAAESISGRVERPIVVLNDTSRPAMYEAFDLRCGPSTDAEQTGRARALTDPARTFGLASSTCAALGRNDPATRPHL